MGCNLTKHASSPRNTKGQNITEHLIWEKEQNFREVYNIEELIGEGSISNIYLVRKKPEAIVGSAQFSDIPVNTVLEQTKTTGVTTYALKEIDLDLVNETFMDEMRNEINLLRKLDHPNIIRAFEVYRDKGIGNHISIVLELCSGGDLSKREPYTEPHASFIVERVLKAIKYLHKKGIIHRDIKFENIMFESNDPNIFNVKLIDFGLSTKYLKNKKLTDRVGTVYTMSPQVIQGCYGPPADLWSIGVVTYQLISGEKPFWGSTLKEIAREVRNGEYSFTSPVWEGVSGEAKDLVSKLLVKDPMKRYNTDQALEHPWVRIHANQAMAKEGMKEDLLKNLHNYSKAGEFQKLAMQVIAKKSSPDDILELRRIFYDIDTGRTGEINYQEFKRALSKTDMYESQQIDNLFRSLDVNECGCITYTEFLAAALKCQGRIEEQRIAEAFDQFDEDNSGYITRDNLRKILGANVKEDYIDKLMMEVSTAKGGKIGFSQFKSALAVRNDTSLERLGK